MIIIAGIPSESPTRLAIESAEALGIEHVVLNQRHAHLYTFTHKIENGLESCYLEMYENTIDLTKIKGIYPRLMDYNQLPEIKDKVFHYVGDALANKSILFQQLFSDYTEIADCRVLNPPMAMLSNISKPYQAQIIGSCGFLIPQTCITSSSFALKNIQNELSTIIFKSISSARSIVKVLDESFDKDLERLKYLPVQFQECLAGINIRVHVVGDVLFATKIESEIVDYRYANREGKTTELSAFNLPENIADKCFLLSRKLNLPLCGIDLFLTNNNEYYCFEVNPSPGYSYYQANTGQDISGAIVRWLEYGTAKY